MDLFSLLLFCLFAFICSLFSLLCISFFVFSCLSPFSCWFNLQSVVWLAKYVLTILELNCCELFGHNKKKLKGSRRKLSCKTGHFTSWKERERLWNVQKIKKTHVLSVQSWCFLFLNTQIFDVVVVVASAPMYDEVGPVGFRERSAGMVKS